MHCRREASGCQHCNGLQGFLQLCCGVRFCERTRQNPQKLFVYCLVDKVLHQHHMLHCLICIAVGGVVGTHTHRTDFVGV